MKKLFLIMLLVAIPTMADEFVDKFLLLYKEYLKTCPSVSLYSYGLFVDNKRCDEIIVEHEIELLNVEDSATIKFSGKFENLGKQPTFDGFVDFLKKKQNCEKYTVKHDENILESDQSNWRTKNGVHYDYEIREYSKDPVIYFPDTCEKYSTWQSGAVYEFWPTNEKYTVWRDGASREDRSIENEGFPGEYYDTWDMPVDLHPLKWEALPENRGDGMIIRSNGDTLIIENWKGKDCRIYGKDHKNAGQIKIW